MTVWLDVVGIGEEGLRGVGEQGAALINSADVLVGGERHFQMIPTNPAQERLQWPSPFRALIDELEARRGSKVCVLATGDPMFYGVGTTLARSFGVSDMAVHPAPSSINLACARLGWSVESINVVSVHGRALSTVVQWLQPGRRLLVISHGASTPGDVGALLQEHGFGASPITVLEHLGGERERVTPCDSASVREGSFEALSLVAIDARAGTEQPWWPRVPGLPDGAYEHDGQLTKRVVRAATLAALAPAPGQRLWDIGAGSGAISIEWMRSAPRATAIAIERNLERTQRITRNAHALGTPQLEVVVGAAPDALDGLAPPDAIFLGGGLKLSTFDACWELLPAGGRLVTNAVTLEGQSATYDFQARYGGNVTSISVAPVRAVGQFRSFDPLRPVIQYEVTKP
jgi:precorrin-6B C5,15-methyltransferase / cobalt-precorrin-6B C5,C15-methyltransferase